MAEVLRCAHWLEDKDRTDGRHHPDPYACDASNHGGELSWWTDSDSEERRPRADSVSHRQGSGGRKNCCPGSPNCEARMVTGALQRRVYGKPSAGATWTSSRRDAPGALERSSAYSAVRAPTEYQQPTSSGRSDSRPDNMQRFIRR